MKRMTTTRPVTIATSRAASLATSRAGVARSRAAILTALLALTALAVAWPLAGMAKPRSESTASVTPKPSAPIAITHRLSGEPALGQPVEVILSIAAEGEMTGVNLRFDADDPLAMIDPADSLGIGTLHAGEGADVAVTVLPLLDRTHYLSVTVTAFVDGMPQSRTIAVPIRLPGSERRESDNDAADDAEEGLHSFGAVETVR